MIDLFRILEKQLSALCYCIMSHTSGHPFLSIQYFYQISREKFEPEPRLRPPDRSSALPLSYPGSTASPRSKLPLETHATCKALWSVTLSAICLPLAN